MAIALADDDGDGHVSHVEFLNSLVSGVPVFRIAFRLTGYGSTPFMTTHRSMMPGRSS